MNKILTILLSFLGFALGAQNSSPAMADAFREDGKIYVVIGVLLLIFICIAGYLVWQDRKITKLEKEIYKKKE